MKGPRRAPHFYVKKKKNIKNVKRQIKNLKQREKIKKVD